MGGGLMQLVAYGSQDIYLTGNPQITFFKVVYRRHTNFSMESIKQSFSGNPDFGATVSATISRNGDLIHRMYLEHSSTFTHSVTDSRNNLNLVERYGDSLIKECEIEIGGQRIDKHTSMWNRVYSDLTEFNPSGHFGASQHPRDTGTHPQITGNGTLSQLMKGNGFGLNTGRYASSINIFSPVSFANTKTVNGFTYTNPNTTPPTHPSSINVNRIFLPLNFWFNRNPGLSLPLIALQYHEVKINMTFEELRNLLRITSTNTSTLGNNQFTDARPFDNGINISSTIFDLWCDYIYLDTDERRRFAQVSHEYLIDQVQIKNTTISQATERIELNFNHPVKELIWIMRNETTGPTGLHDGGRHQTPNVNLGDSSSGPTSIDEIHGNWRLILNGHDRFKERESKYFSQTQVWQHHSGYGGVPTAGYDHHLRGNLPQKGDEFDGGNSILVYSFALKPEEHQPSGTCNFSRIDNAELVGSDLSVDIDSHRVGSSNATNVKLTIFAVNYNVLRIMSGMGGLAYSN